MRSLTGASEACGRVEFLHPRECLVVYRRGPLAIDCER